MTDANTFYKRGLDTGSAYQEGEDAAFNRGVGRAKAVSDLEISRQRARGLGVVNDTNAYNLERNKSVDTELDSVADEVAPGPKTPFAAPPSGGIPAPSNPARAAAPANGLADPGAAPGAAPAPIPRGTRQRALARIALRKGDIKQANELNAQADTYDQLDIFEHGAKLAKDPAAVEAVLRMVNQDPKITFARDAKGGYSMSVVQPDLKAEQENLSGAQIATLLGAQALFDAGHVQAALGKFGEVSKNLAAEMATRNAAQQAAASFGQKVQHEGNQDQAAFQNANAHMRSADAAMMNAGANATRAAREPAAPKTMSPEDAAQLNQLSLAVDDAKTPEDRAKAVAAFRRAQSTVLAKMGRVMEPGEGRTPPKPVSEETIQSYIADRTSQDPEFKGLPYDQKRAAAKAALSGSSEGGVPDVASDGPLVPNIKPQGKGVPAPSSEPKTKMGAVTGSRDPMTGKTTWRVEGVPGRFHSKEEADAALKAASTRTGKF